MLHGTHLENAGFMLSISKCLFSIYREARALNPSLLFSLNSFVILGKTHAFESKRKEAGYCIG